MYFNNVLDCVAPIKNVCLKQRTEAWISPDILNYIKERDTFLYTFKKSKNKEDYESFCKYRNIVHREVKQAKQEYLSNKIEENKNDSKSLWKQLKTFLTQTLTLFKRLKRRETRLLKCFVSKQ